MLRFALAVAAILTIAPTANAQSAGLAGSVMEAADQKNWLTVRNFTNGDPVIADLAMWRILSAGEGTWRDYSSFIAQNPDWPNLKRIRAKGERTMPSGLSLLEIDGFLGSERPQTGTGALRRAEALRAAGRANDAAAEIVTAWRTLSMTAEEQNEYRAYHGPTIQAYHRDRADELAWRGLTSEAEAMAALLDPGYAALIRARVLLRRRADGVDAAIKAVPASLQSDPGLAYERFVWRMRKNRYDGAADIIRAQSGSAATLGRPELWGDRRRLLVRRMLRLGQVIPAYNLANQNHMTEGSNYSDLEWLAGWIALRRMHEPDRAIAHFSRFLAAVATPISYGRGNYWMGRAHEAKRDQNAARDWYARAAEHQTSYYGQLAATKIGAGPKADLAALPGGSWKSAPFANRTVTRATVALSRDFDRRRAHWFLTHIASTLSSYEDLASVAQLATELGREDAAIRISKIAARKGHVLQGHYYPLNGLAQFNRGVEPALAMAIARQESELNIEAISPAGARGLMQLMPGTAKKVSGWLDMPYNKARLTTDWQYNATLGQTYLARRLDQFGGSVAMAAAAYNAGAGRVDQWIERYGDPRAPGVDVVDWIETIPFRETRNYVQRVLEGLQVYRNRIAGGPVPFRVLEDAVGR